MVAGTNRGTGLFRKNRGWGGGISSDRTRSKQPRERNTLRVPPIREKKNDQGQHPRSVLPLPKEPRYVSGTGIIRRELTAGKKQLSFLFLYTNH